MYIRAEQGLQSGACEELEAHRPKAAFICWGILLVVGITGCRQDMQNQSKMLPQRSTTFFADGRSVRPQVAGTVARSQGNGGSYFLTGMIDGKEGDGMPFTPTLEVLKRGQERYNIYCSPCHSRVGNGLGMIVQRGYHLAGDFHTERLREVPLGHFFTVITNGYGTMPNYAAELSPVDRWAVVSYIRALQLSQNASSADVTPGAAVASLPDLAERAGLPKSFAERWKAPLSTPVPAKAAPAMQAVTTLSPPAVAVTTSTKLAGSPVEDVDKKAVAVKEKGAAKAPSAADIASGKHIYVQNCQVCHQPERTGLPPAIPSLIGAVEKVGVGRIRGMVADGVPTGKPPMPAFPDLSSEDVDKLIVFLRSPR